MEAASCAAGGLVNYVRSVVAALGAEVVTADVDVDEEVATVIILVHCELPTLPGLPLLLTWDEVNGWALRVEVSGEGDTVVVSYLADDILPVSQAVSGFLDGAARGAQPGEPTPPGFRAANDHDDLEDRLAGYVA